MKFTLKSKLPLLLAALALGGAARAGGQSTVFTYQGRLADAGLPTGGRYDFIFQVFDTATGGGSIGPTVNANGMLVTNGLFTVRLDFGSSPFIGPARWLQIQVSPTGAGAYSTLSPRQELTGTPYATHAATAGSLAAGQAVRSLNGLTDIISLVAGNNITLTPVGNTLTIAASGDGAFSLNGSSAYYNGGNVGIGTTTPQSPLHVLGPSGNFGLLGTASEGIHGVGYGSSAGVRGAQSPTGAYGALGIALNEGVVGVYGNQGFGDMAASFRGRVAITNAYGGNALRIDSLGGAEALRIWSRGAPGAKITSDYCTALQVEGGGGCYAMQVWALRTDPPAGKGLEVFGESDFNGNFTVRNGSKSAIVPTSQGQRKLYCEESSQVWFADYGSARLTNGVAVLRIDPLFAETVNLERPYHVFVQLNDAECEGVAVLNRRPDAFEVRERRGGASSAEFSYRLVALRRGFEDARLEPATAP